MPSQIIGSDELVRKLRRISNLDFLRPHIQSGVTHIANKMKIYPDAGSGNDPSRTRWYQRGYGQKWRRKDGSVGGYQSSEDLQQRWLGKVLSNTRGEIGNDASYAPYVQGGEEQSSVMREIGWKTTDQVVEEESEFVLREIQKAVDRELAKG